MRRVETLSKWLEYEEFVKAHPRRQEYVKQAAHARKKWAALKQREMAVQADSGNSRILGKSSSMAVQVRKKIFFYLWTIFKTVTFVDNSEHFLKQKQKMFWIFLLQILKGNEKKKKKWTKWEINRKGVSKQKKKEVTGPAQSGNPLCVHSAVGRNKRHIGGPCGILTSAQACEIAVITVRPKPKNTLCWTAG